MEERLLQVLKRAKEVDKRAQQFDSTRKNDSHKHSNDGFMSIDEQYEKEIPDMVMPQFERNSKPIDVNSDFYKQRIKGSKLPAEIQNLMLENPIQQIDTFDSFTLSEEAIKEINPNSKTNISETTKQRELLSISEDSIRRMIQEEIIKIMPQIVDRYFDKKMIQENIKLLNTFNKKRTQIK